MLECPHCGADLWQYVRHWFDLGWHMLGEDGECTREADEPCPECGGELHVWLDVAVEAEARVAE